MTVLLALAGAPEVDVHVRRSQRARRLSLRVSRLDGRVTLTMPLHVSERQARAFLEDRCDWVKQHLAQQPTQVCVDIGVRLPVLGQGLVLAAAPVRAARQEGDRLLVAEHRAGPQARAWVQQVARERLAVVCAGYAQALGVSFTQMVLRDTRSRWGSCSSAGRLMFSWRLALAPSRILDYVAAHEVAHLVEMNHSADFWALVGRLHPSWQEDRTWLHANGAWVHRYRFEGDR